MEQSGIFLATLLCVPLAACAATDRGASGGGGTGAFAWSGGNGGNGAAISVGGSGGGGGSAPSCKVAEATGDAVPECTQKSPPDSFNPVVQWTWTAPDPEPGEYRAFGSTITPLVGNFTDDNHDGAIDLCDTPDILVVAFRSLTLDPTSAWSASESKMHLLSGDTGFEKLVFEGLVDGWTTPAFGDIDQDGLPEVVTSSPDGRLVAYENDGKLKWTGAVAGYRATLSSAHCSTVSLYDLDGDGGVEILFGFEVFDASGQLLWGVPGNAAEYKDGFWCVTPTAADLDGDGTLEVLFGHEAYRANGQPYFKVPGHSPGHPHVGNFDGDPEPEILLTTKDGISLLDHKGQVLFQHQRPTGGKPQPNCWGKPGVIHDFDGDGVNDIAAGSCTDFTVYNIFPSGAVPKWTQKIEDMSGLATATAFDFLGDGVPEALYADEHEAYAFDGQTGVLSLKSPRNSGTLIEYPVVADVDNDGSAEIVVVSNYFEFPGSPPPTVGPTVTVLRDADDRWIPARRIWNQHAYHVTNVREDGTIPAVPKKSWLGLNTFRANSQVGAAGICDPPDPPK